MLWTNELSILPKNFFNNIFQVKLEYTKEPKELLPQRWAFAITKEGRGWRKRLLATYFGTAVTQYTRQLRRDTGFQETALYTAILQAPRLATIFRLLSNSTTKLF